MVPDMPPSPPVAPPPLPPTLAQPRTAAPPGVAAIVNGKKITRAQVASEALKAIGPQLVNQMIIIELINQESAKQNIMVPQAEVAARLADIEKQYAEHGIPGGLDALLAQRHQTLATYTEQLRTELMVEALVAKTLPPAPPTPRYHLRHLLVMTSPNPQTMPGAAPPHTDAEALARIAKAQAELKAGRSFATVANEYTEDPTGKGNGGDLGVRDAKTPFDPNFLKAALALKPGQVTPTPVKSQYGYHLIAMESTSQAPLPSDKKLYDDAAALDRRQQIQQAIPGYVQTLRSRAKIEDYLTEQAPPTPVLPPQPTPSP